MNVGKYLFRRLVQVPLVVLIITIAVFALMHVSPGDPISIMLGVYASPEAVEALRQEFHLDKPLPVQYFLWLLRLGQGDLGVSIRTREKVTQMIWDRFPISFLLALSATLFSIGIALITGVVAAYKHNTFFDYFSMLFAMAGLSIPNFALALLLVFLFAVHLGWFPISGIGLTSFWEDPWQAMAPFVLPTVALGVPQAAVLARLLRATMLEILSQEYIRVAYAKGLSDWTLLLTHALKNALIPVITVLAINFAYLVGTTITIEYIFAIPGMGTAMIQAVINRDFPVIQGFALFIALFFIFTNMVADLIYVFIDPRIRYT